MISEASNGACNKAGIKGKLSGLGGASNACPSPDRQPTIGGSAMPANAQDYTESVPKDKTEQPVNTWKPIGDLAARLVQKAVQK